MPDQNAPRGLFDQLQGSLGSVLELIRVRLALLGTELALEKQRVGLGLLWAASAFMLLTVAAVLLCGFVILLLWDGYRLAAVGTLAVSFAAAGIVLARVARRRLAQESNLFGVSLAELDRDRAAVKNPPTHDA
ncbi:MAG: phage holin family protein [Rhodoferax sp.]|nr:phage holin family protein [Rhodoferax sp.]OIP21565.1 MAG: hypothetical protein AUK52_08205 [Comamonadaceae bacterium CG2_30_60_41]PIW09555.1 MAG: hypothetical protein COW39_04355 [Comamonadaceae bacterium CG17_big_fil_post_rev_8_21_14_2_50_60_13]PIY26735.1 MAG: hypothetical protein COZ10_01740 [Comamonadaceae bacterium CG_4_10_14_3_um_filter_60_75]PJC11830.1 MAG: hypothetical protein CO066_13535 [Comamonadaceae bacterium CG_4_9_14_0_8_um_filter_60_18]